MNQQIPITVAYEKGIGPEIMDATLRIITTANTNIKPDVIDTVTKYYNEKDSLEFTENFTESLSRTKIFFKSLFQESKESQDIEKSIEKSLGINKYILPYYSYLNIIEGNKDFFDTIFIFYNNYFHNEIEYKQSQNVFNIINSFSIPDLINVLYDTFEFASENNRKKISFVINKPNKKFDDKLFFNYLPEISEKYPNIETEIIDYEKLMEFLKSKGDNLDVVVIKNNSYNFFLESIIDDKYIKGLFGICGVGDNYIIFKSLQDASFEIAGKNQANPTGLLIASIMMLNYLKEFELAHKIQLALTETIKDGIHTKDIFREGISKELVGTQEFADEIIKRMKEPQENAELKTKPIFISNHNLEKKTTLAKEHQELIGVDLYINWAKGSASDLGDMLKKIVTENLRLEFISNKGKIVYPVKTIETNYTDLWLCRYIRKDIADVIKHTEIIELLDKIYNSGFDFTKLELLFNFNGKAGFSNL